MSRWAQTDLNTVPVMRPRLPELSALAPYISEIDKNGWYSNYGPLVSELEKRMSLALGGEPGTVLSAGNGTAALAAALIALDLPRGALVAVPAWTFCATAHAVHLAGLTPYLVDVDETSWALLPEEVERARHETGVRIGAVMPVTPFGAPLDVEGWADFRRRTGIPVIVDAAAGFDTWRICNIPAVISLHATKVLGAGEGGLIVSSDVEFIERSRRILNFGFDGLAIAECHAFNGKMSEYAAAVGLAALDAWPRTREEWRTTAGLHQALRSHPLVATQPGLGDHWVGSVLVVRFPDRDGRKIAAILAEQGVQSRPWWPLALNEHPAFAACPWYGARVARQLSRECLGLPYFRGITAETANRVNLAVHTALQAA